ncbi:MAG: ATPase [Streptococcaceae bacterium]|nr:ATPase [Streptococcaceae bacterium]
MKKLIYSITLFTMVSFPIGIHADTTTSGQETQTATSAANENTQSSQSSTSSSSTSSSSNSSDSTGTAESTQTPASTTTAQQNVTENSQAQNNQTQRENNAQATTRNTTTQEPTKGSTTIINETVNNTGKNSANIWTIILTSLSATVTIIGGVTALIRHFHKKIKAKNAPNDKSLTKVVKKSQTEDFTKETAILTASPSLTETQKMNLQADRILKNQKKQSDFRRRRR